MSNLRINSASQLQTQTDCVSSSSYKSCQFQLHKEKYFRISFVSFTQKLLLFTAISKTEEQRREVFNLDQVYLIKIKKVSFKKIWTQHKCHVLWPNFIDHDCRLQSWFWLWFLVTIYFDTGNKLSSHLLHHYFLKACQFDNFNIQWQQMTTKVPLKDWIITPLHQQTKL